MKKTFALIIVITCLLIFIFGTYINKINVGFSNSNYVGNNKTNLAITLDGQRVSNFPSKGMYRVDVTCENADGKWDYDNWNLSIKNVVNTATCDVDFTTISKTYFNNYIMSLAGTSQGDGQLVNETDTFAIPNINTYTDLSSSSQYVSYSRYYSTSSSATSGTSASSAFTFSGTRWRTNPNSMTSGNYYYLKFNIPSTGYYEACFTLNTESTDGFAYVFVNDTARIRIYPTMPGSECSYIGYLSSSDSVRFRVDGDTAQLYFNLKRTTSTNNATIGYRYEGSDPNNYVLFNNELWRIIGVVDSSSHGVSGQNLVKIVRDDSLNGLVSTSSQNDYHNSSLKTILNNYYYNKQDATNSGYCYNYHTSSNSLTNAPNCNYTVDGINSTYRSMIQEVTWYQGGAADDTATIKDVFQNERELGVDGLHAQQTTAKIGLIYFSDYLYSALSSDCSRNTLSSNYFESNSCGAKNWLTSKQNLITITPYIDHINLQYTIEGSSWPNMYGIMIYPSLYLNSSVYVIDGDGSIDDPYIIGM